MSKKKKTWRKTLPETGSGHCWMRRKGDAGYSYTVVEFDHLHPGWIRAGNFWISAAGLGRVEFSEQILPPE
jgi:hypothetical protein